MTELSVCVQCEERKASVRHRGYFDDDLCDACINALTTATRKARLSPQMSDEELNIWMATWLNLLLCKSHGEITPDFCQDRNAAVLGVQKIYAAATDEELAVEFEYALFRLLNGSEGSAGAWEAFTATPRQICQAIHDAVEGGK